MYSLSKIPLLLVFLAWLASADDNIFVFPDENSTVTPAWVLGETQEIKWNTTYDMVDFGFNAADTATVVWVVGLSSVLPRDTGNLRLMCSSLSLIPSSTHRKHQKTTNRLQLDSQHKQQCLAY